MKIVAAAILLSLTVAPAALAGWTQNGPPILTPTQPWEQTAVFEPTVLKVKDGYRMWYTGGWEVSATGTATSRDGIHWTKYAGNPIIPNSARNSVVRHGSKFWLYYSDGYGAARDSIRLAVSSDGIHFGPSLEVLAPPVWADALANTSVIHDGNHWVMVFEAKVGNTWQLGIATSSDGINWAPSDHPIGAPLDAAGPTYGAPDLVKRGNLYQLYFLAGGTANGALPTSVYYSESANLVNWTPPLLVVDRSEPWEVDQTADPWQVGGLLFFAGCDNPTATCAIGLATLG